VIKGMNDFEGWDDEDEEKPKERTLKAYEQVILESELIFEKNKKCFACFHNTYKRDEKLDTFLYPNKCKKLVNYTYCTPRKTGACGDSSLWGPGDYPFRLDICIEDGKGCDQPVIAKLNITSEYVFNEAALDDKRIHGWFCFSPKSLKKFLNYLPKFVESLRFVERVVADYYEAGKI